MDISNFSQNDEKKLTYTGSKIFVTGVSADNFGGDTEYPFGIVKESQDRTPQTGLWESIHLMILKTGNRMRMCSIPGLHLGFGRWQPWAGQMRRQ